MTNRSTSWIKGIILAGLALMFAVKINTGTLNFYINQRFAWLALVGTPLLAFGLWWFTQRSVGPTRTHRQFLAASIPPAVLAVKLIAGVFWSVAPGGNTAQGPFLLLLAAVAGIFVWGVLMLIDMVRWLSGYSQRWLREN